MVRLEKAVDDAGLSPLARGNRLPNVKPHSGRRSIPAGAGEPAWGGGYRHHVRVYPRWRGGTWSGVASNDGARGLSPLARGNRVPAPVLGKPAGSIPAGAGEPWPSTWPRTDRGVYPRWRGGTTCKMLPSTAVLGLSPLARGNLVLPDSLRAVRGSIPAGAGEPEFDSEHGVTRKVYPRWRGGTQTATRL